MSFGWNRDSIIVLAVMVFLGATNCAAESDFDSFNASTYSDFEQNFKSNRPLKFAAFNIQIFGKKKMKQPDVAEILIKILLRYDLILIQEIRDSEEKWTKILLERINQRLGTNDQFDAIISPRLGRSASKEQYAFFYRKRLLSVKSSFVFDDGPEIENCVTKKEKKKKKERKEEYSSSDKNGAGNKSDAGDATASKKPACVDAFEREPFVVRFASPTTAVSDFAVIACHASPGNAVAEIDALVDVHRRTKSRWGRTDVIIAGDLNAGCNYLPKKYWSDIRLRNTRYWTWLIPDNADTTTGYSHCPYDRFVLSRRGRLASGGVIRESASVFDFRKFYGLDLETALRVSDHYPIELQLLPSRKSP